MLSGYYYSCLGFNFRIKFVWVRQFPSKYDNFRTHQCLIAANTAAHVQTESARWQTNQIVGAVLSEVTSISQSSQLIGHTECTVKRTSLPSSSSNVNINNKDQTLLTSVALLLLSSQDGRGESKNAKC